MDVYIRAAFNELLAEDGLAVMARGMGIERLLIKFLHYFSIPQQSAGEISNQMLSAEMGWSHFNYVFLSFYNHTFACKRHLSFITTSDIA